MRPILSVALSLAGFVAQAQTDEPGKWLVQGVASYRQAHYPEAAAAFQKVVDLTPSDATAHLYLATAWLQMYIPGAESPENLAAAAKAGAEFHRVLDLDASNASAILSLGSLNLNLKKWEQARSWYQRAISLNSRDKGAYYSLGVIAWSQWYPEYTGARARLGMKPADAGPLSDRGVRQELRDRYGAMLDEAVSNLKQALAIDPGYDDAMAYMNLIIRERADLDDSSGQYQIDIQLANDWVDQALQAKRQKAVDSERAKRVEPLTKVDPVYPPLAIEARVSGVVRLKVVIGKDGHVRDVRLVSGHPLLAQPAMDAVRQWVYQPILAGGEPVETTLEVAVPFALPN